MVRALLFLVPSLGSGFPNLDLTGQAGEQINDPSAGWLKTKPNWGWEGTVMSFRKGFPAEITLKLVFEIGKA